MNRNDSGEGPNAPPPQSERQMKMQDLAQSRTWGYVQCRPGARSGLIISILAISTQIG